MVLQKRVISFAAACCAVGIAPAACGSSSQPLPPTGTVLIHEAPSGTISAVTSPTCSSSFRLSVDAAYYSGGTERCAEYSRASTTSGIITARLSWEDRRIDLDLVLNNGAGSNYRQSIAANREPETVEFFVNAGTSYVFVVYLRGVDPQFLADGGQFSGDVATPFTLSIERPQ